MNILILFGSKSTEHEISILSLFQIKDSIDTKKYNVYYVYITKDNDLLYFKDINLDIFKNNELKKGKKVSFIKKGIKIGFKQVMIDSSLLVLHGSYGEDGVIPSLLDFYDIPYSSSYFKDMAVCHDKGYFKDVLKANNFNIIKYEILNEKDGFSNIKLKTPYIIKPCSLGSSIGIKVINNLNELDDSIFRFDSKVIVEKYLKEIREFNIALRSEKDGFILSMIEEVIKSNDLLSFDDKYNSGNVNNRIIPAKVSDELKKEIEEVSLKIGNLFNLKGVFRIDFIYSNEKLFVSEINLIPGSLAFYLFKENKKNFIDGLLKEGFSNYLKRNKKVYKFDSNILNINKSIKK